MTNSTSLDKSQTAQLRTEYAGKLLDEHGVAADPLLQFAEWFNEAVLAAVAMPNAMTLATASADGIPSARIVLLKEINGGDFVFYTNYRSRKSRELDQNPHAALLFFWPELDRQIRIEGTITKVTAKESEEYFKSRPRGSQIGAHASEQSAVVSGRAALEDLFAQLEKQYEGMEVPRPAFWGGFRLSPVVIEFWQGRENRLHDRIAYRRRPDGRWAIVRLSP